MYLDLGEKLRRHAAIVFRRTPSYQCNAQRRREQIFGSVRGIGGFGEEYFNNGDTLCPEKWLGLLEAAKDFSARPDSS